MRHQNVSSTIYAGLKTWADLLEPLDLPLDGFRYLLAFGGYGRFLRGAHASLCAQWSISALILSSRSGWPVSTRR